MSRVLLVSSTGRSGSSFLGQILASRPSSLYYFEPLKLLNALPTPEVWPGIQGLLTCNISDKFAKAVIGWPRILNDNAGIHQKSCNRTCLRYGGLAEICRSKDVIVIKTIRMRVAWMVPLLNTLPSLRVIHLIRDPRGSLTSLSRLWKSPYDERCADISEDLVTGKAASSLYPDRFVPVHNYFTV